ncbi:MAG: hypothetical protein CVT84_15370 [Alphaproteobacteria bacterium HGW-Alphaproteobacteria-6]|nr:MAG: hypothetical protein CVT84_15370 [Alphaproteobacteria bacterium HGW-Alphaproteobacteria-6]
MTTVSALFDAYVDINLLLVLACGLSAALGAGLGALRLGHLVSVQLRLMRLGFLAVLIGPVVLALAPLRGAVAPAASVNLSDFVVSQYLQGRFEMSPGALQQLLGWRDMLHQTLLGAGSPAALAVLAVLAAGVALFAVRLIVSIARLRAMIGASYHWRRFGRLELRLSDTVLVPFSTRGLSRRYVVVPSSMLANDADLRIALGHELQHLRQRDVEWEIGLEMLKPLFFWNPAFHLWKRRMERLRELACDRQVVTRRGYAVAEYCQCLLRVCGSSLRRGRLFAVDAPVVALVRTENRLFAQRSAQLLRDRMVTLIEGRAERHPAVLVALLTGPLVGLMLLAAVAIQKPGDWSQDRIMLSTIINLERLQALNRTSTLSQPGF